MSEQAFNPTEEQKAIIRHNGTSFITACPGAGKTRVLTERARRLIPTLPPGCGIAFLSFTQAAISELDSRLRKEGLLSSPVFPSFIGTFDSFVWQFLVAPFGLEESEVRPRLIPDIAQIKVEPFDNAHPLPLSCFCPQTGQIFERAAKAVGFDLGAKPKNQIQAYQTSAAIIRKSLRENGQLGFDEARSIALNRLNNDQQRSRIAAALRGRFYEVTVDEAQDCNPDDLTILSFLQEACLPIKVVCDPQQSIYEFRGGVTDHLVEFAKTFSEDQCKKLTGNFRSSPNICKAVSQLRPLSARGKPDEALGPYKAETSKIQILSYKGRKVPATIGKAFCDLLQDIDISVSSAPIVAATRASGAAAAGQPRPAGSGHRVIRLAEAVISFQFASGYSDIKNAVESVHRILLELEGRLDEHSYHQYLVHNDIEPASWRAKVVSIIQELRFNPSVYSDARAWHTAAKELLSGELTIEGTHSISQMLRWNSKLDAVLSSVPDDAPMPRTIHSVKGMAYPAVCVVTTASTLKGILDFLETGSSADKAEDARKLYVAASRAERLLVIAAPSSQAARLRAHLSAQGSVVSITEI